MIGDLLALSAQRRRFSRATLPALAGRPADFPLHSTSGFLINSIIVLLATNWSCDFLQFAVCSSHGAIMINDPRRVVVPGVPGANVADRSPSLALRAKF